MAAHNSHEQLEVDSKPHHNCGVAGAVFAPDADVNPALVIGEVLVDLENRGPAAAGVAVAPRPGEEAEAIFGGLGRPENVLTRNGLSGLPKGIISIGQDRYTTQGVKKEQGYRGLQPIHRQTSDGRHIYLAHNGEFGFDSIEGHASDTYKAVDEIVGLMEQGHDLPVAMSRFFATVRDSAYSITAMTPQYLLAARDPFGRHPLYYGYSEPLDAFLVASESPALTRLDVAKPISLPPGFMARFYPGEEPELSAFVANPADARICMLEAIYFARPDGELEGHEIFEIRKRAGILAALEDEGLDFDVVVAVPDSARAAAEGVSIATGKLSVQGIIKPKNIRSFLQEDQASRRRAVLDKFRIIPSQVRGRKIVLVEDSIVRGTTMESMVNELKAKGALEVHVRIASPMMVDTCEYGINIPTKEELIAHRHGGDLEAIRQEIKADSLRYLSVPDSRRSIPGAVGRNACMKCFTGRKPKDDFVYIDPFQ